MIKLLALLKSENVGLFAIFAFEVYYFYFITKLRKKSIRWKWYIKLVQKPYLRAIVINSIRKKAFFVFTSLIFIYVIYDWYALFLGSLILIPFFISYWRWLHLWYPSLQNIFLEFCKDLLIATFIIGGVVIFGSFIVGTLFGFVSRLIISYFNFGSDSFWILFGMVIGFLYFLNSAWILGRRFYLPQTPVDKNVQKDILQLFEWAQLKIPRIHVISEKHSQSLVVELDGSVKESGWMTYTLFIGERALKILTTGELNSLLRREVARVRSKIIGVNLLFKILILIPTVLFSYLIAIVLKFYIPNYYNIRISLIISCLIFFYFMKQKKNSDETSLDLLAIAKFGANKLHLYSALKKLTLEAGEILNKTAPTFELNPFRHSLSFNYRANLIFSKKLKIGKGVRDEGNHLFKRSLVFLQLANVILLILIFFHWKTEFLFLYDTYKNNYEHQSYLLKKGFQVETPFYFALGISPFEVAKYNKDERQFLWLMTQIKDTSYKAQILSGNLNPQSYIFLQVRNQKSFSSKSKK